MAVGSEGRAIVELRTGPDLRTGRVRVDARLSCGHPLVVLLGRNDRVPALGDVLPCESCTPPPEIAALSFAWPGDDPPIIDLIDLWPNAYLERTPEGRLIQRFQAPFEDLAIHDGDVLDDETAAQLRAAVAHFKGSTQRAVM